MGQKHIARNGCAARKREKHRSEDRPLQRSRKGCQRYSWYSSATWTGVEVAAAKAGTELPHSKSGAEEDRFALEHFDGEEEGGGGVDAGGKENDGNEIPVVGAGDEFFAEKADVEDRDKRKFGSKLNAGKHGGDGRDDDDKGHRREIALGLFVGLGEESDGHQGGGEQNGDGKSHEEDGDDRFGSELEEKSRGRGASACRLCSVVGQDGERNAHRQDGESGRTQCGREDQKKFAQDEMHARDGTGKDGFHCAALFFASGEVHGGIHRAAHAEKDDHITDDAAESGAADFFGRRDVFLLHVKRSENGFREILGRETFLDHLIAVVLQVLFDLFAREFGFQFSLIVINFDGV